MVRRRIFGFRGGGGYSYHTRHTRQRARLAPASNSGEDEQRLSSRSQRVAAGPRHGRRQWEQQQRRVCTCSFGIRQLIIRSYLCQERAVRVQPARALHKLGLAAESNGSNRCRPWSGATSCGHWREQPRGTGRAQQSRRRVDASTEQDLQDGGEAHGDVHRVELRLRPRHDVV